VPLVNSANISGVNAPTLEILNASAADAGLYDAVVSNQFETVTSAEAILSVRDTCPTDTNADGTIDVLDLVEVVRDFGTCP